jgi:general secretion pathway protein D
MPALSSTRFQRFFLRAIAFGIAVAATAWLPAQSFSPETPAGSAAPRGGPSTGGSQLVTSGDDNAATVKVNFPNTPIQGIIPVYQQLTGKMMILDGQLQGESLKIIGTRPLTKAEAIAFIEASLLLNGYAIVEVNKETVKLIHHSGGKDPTSERIPVFTSIVDLPEKEQIVHFVMPLQHISPEEAVKAFTTVIKPHGYGKVIAVNNTSNIIITENTATIRSMLDLAREIDVPPAEVANELIELKRSDPKTVAEIIQDIYEDKEKAATAPTSVQGQQVASPGAPPPNPGMPNIPSAPGGGGGASNTNPTNARVKVIPHERTGSILVIARPVDITYIKDLVEKLDRESTDRNFLERKLKYMPVGEFLAIAKDALSRDTDMETEEGSGGGGTQGGAAPRSRAPRSNQNDQAGMMGNRQQQSNPYGNQFGGGMGGGMGGGAMRSSLEGPEELGHPESVVVGKTLLIADTRNQTLIVQGPPEHIEIVDKLIERMDVRPTQIYISAVIGQLALGNGYDYGIDFLTALEKNLTFRRRGPVPTTGTSPGTGAGAAAGIGFVDAPLDDEVISAFDIKNFNIYGQLGTLGSFIKLADKDSQFKVMNRPAIWLRNNEKGTLSSGQRVAVPVSSLSNLGYGGQGNTAAVQSSIDYRDVVLKLEVVPLINSGDEVTLKVLLVNDNLGEDQELGGNKIPKIITQEMSTTVTAKNGSTVVLGGLITEQERKSKSGLIGINRIPILNKIFSRNTISMDRQELLIFIQPQIIKSEDPLDKPNEFEEGRSRVMGEALRFAEDRPEVRRATPARY